ncbi:hypothetical protein RJD24_07815 [Bacillaceae bacterium IKA-2]|nr:hypothetical protein RJD24_07815 [Bacillaceae bacterium IKA-2]
MIRIVLFLVVSLLFVQPFSTYANKQEGQLTFLVRSSSQSLFQSVLTVEADRLFQTIINTEPLHEVTDLPFSNHYLMFEDEAIVRIILMDDFGAFYDLQQNKKIQFPPKTTKKIKKYFTYLDKNHFGELIDWEEVKEIIPRYAKFMITDLETGLSFNAQRRAGSSHADVQPLTKKDTIIMKKINDGNWNWKRRAVLIHVNDQFIAASMHGMPHGKGSLVNGFPGHFCIHFKGSTTHKTKNHDLSHQVMVNKAAGTLTSFLKHLSAEEIAELFFITLNQKDLDLLTLIYNGDVDHYSHIFNVIESIRMSERGEPIIEEALIYEVPIKFIIKEKGKRKVETVFTFVIVRDSPTSEWRLVNVPFE